LKRHGRFFPVRKCWQWGKRARSGRTSNVLTIAQKPTFFKRHGSKVAGVGLSRIRWVNSLKVAEGDSTTSCYTPIMKNSDGGMEGLQISHRPQVGLKLDWSAFIILAEKRGMGNTSSNTYLTLLLIKRRKAAYGQNS